MCHHTSGEASLWDGFSVLPHMLSSHFFFSSMNSGGHCLKKITVEQFILTRQIICQDQRLSVRKKKKTPRPHLQSVITPGGLSGYPKMLCRRCRSGFLTLSFLCVRLCLCVCVRVSARTYTVSGPRSSSWWRTRGFSRRSNVSRWNKRRGRSSLQM